MTPTGTELPAGIPEKTAILQIGGATGGAVAVDLDRLAAHLRCRLSAEECSKLAELLTAERAEADA